LSRFPQTPTQDLRGSSAESLSATPPSPTASPHSAPPPNTPRSTPRTQPPPLTCLAVCCSPTPASGIAGPETERGRMRRREWAPRQKSPPRVREGLTEAGSSNRISYSAFVLVETELRERRTEERRKIEGENGMREKKYENLNTWW